MKSINGVIASPIGTQPGNVIESTKNAGGNATLYQPGVFGPAFQNLSVDPQTERNGIQMSNIIASLLSAVSSQLGTATGTNRGGVRYRRVAEALPKINTNTTGPAVASAFSTTPKTVLSGPPVPVSQQNSAPSAALKLAPAIQEPNLKALFSSVPTPVVAEKPAQTAPTAESAFGPNPWMSNPTGIGPNGQPFSYNKFYFATEQTAAKVAKMAGGKVVKTNMFTPSGGAFSQQQPNYMVEMPDGRLINPGLVASFYTHGYSQSYVEQMVAAEFRG